jgi:hypothetical protein
VNGKDRRVFAYLPQRAVVAAALATIVFLESDVLYSLVPGY